MKIVLLYHRIARDGWRYSVSRDHFAEQLDVLQREVETVSLASLAPGSPDDGSRARVAITFDDGYRDNVTDAWPLLASRGMPATFFVVSGHVGRTREFWWDELECLLARGRGRTRRLALEIDGERRAWDLDEADAAARGHAGAGAFRATAYCALHALLVTRRAGAQRDVLDAVAEALGVVADVRPERLPLTADDVGRLARTDLAEIGAHTVDHVFLPACSIDVQEVEIRRSRRDLEEMAGRPVSSFSYPYGMYAEETVGLVAHAGFARACKVGNEPLAGHHDLVIPRFTPLDWDGEAFAERLHHVLHRDR